MDVEDEREKKREPWLKDHSCDRKKGKEGIKDEREKEREERIDDLDLSEETK
jgi:hypothetical protein